MRKRTATPCQQVIDVSGRFQTDNLKRFHTNLQYRPGKKHDLPTKQPIRVTSFGQVTCQVFGNGPVRRTLNDKYRSLIALPPTFCGRKFSTPIRTASIVALINAFMMLEVRRTSRNGTEKRTGKKAKFVRESPRRSTTNSAKAKRNPVR